MERTPFVTNEANRLYWRTERSVADIAETLGVSRRALYELVTPENAGATCGNCGAEVVYVNRSAKASALGRCPSCGTECEITAEENDLQESVPPYAAGWPRAKAANGGGASRTLKISAVIFAGVAIGAVAAYFIVRRRR